MNKHEYVSSKRYKAVVAELEEAHNEIEQLKAKVSEIEGRFRALRGLVFDNPDGDLEIDLNINKIKADAIREALLDASKLIDSESGAQELNDNILEYAANLEAGTL